MELSFKVEVDPLEDPCLNWVQIQTRYLLVVVSPLTTGQGSGFSTKLKGKKYYQRNMLFPIFDK